MKKRILASLMSLCLLVGLLPTAAFAAEPDTTEEIPQAGVCEVTPGCTLETGHEGDCVVAPAVGNSSEQENNADSQPGGEDITEPANTAPAGDSNTPSDPMNEPEVDETPTAPSNEPEKAPASNAEPVEVQEQGTKGNPWNVSAEGAGNNVTAYLEPNSEDRSSTTYTLVISGTGDMKDFEVGTGNTENRAPWFTTLEDASTSITAVTIGDGVTSIGDYALSKITNLKTLNGNDTSSSKKIVFPAQLTSWGYSLNGSGLSGVLSFPENCQLEDENSLNIFGNNNITGVDWTNYPLTSVPEHWTEYGAAHTALTDLGLNTLPSTVNSIGEYAFKNFQGTSIEIPDTSIQYKKGTFVSSKLTTATINVEKEGSALSENMFSASKDLTTVNFVGNNLEKIPAGSFHDTKLSYLAVPYGVTTIESNSSTDTEHASTFGVSSNSNLDTAVAFVFPSTLAEIKANNNLDELFGNRTASNVSILAPASFDWGTMDGGLKEIGTGVTIGNGFNGLYQYTLATEATYGDDTVEVFSVTTPSNARAEENFENIFGTISYEIEDETVINSELKPVSAGKTKVEVFITAPDSSVKTKIAETTITVAPMPITFGSSTGENPSGTIDHVYDGMAPDYFDYAAFYPAKVDGNTVSVVEGSQEIELTAGTDVVFVYDDGAGDGAKEHDSLPVNVTTTEGMSVTVKMLNPNYRFVTNTNTTPSETVSVTVKIHADNMEKQDLYINGEKVDVITGATVKVYNGEGQAPISDLTSVQAEGIETFTVHFHPLNSDTDFEEAHLESKPASELTSEAVLAIAPKEPGQYLMIVNGIKEATSPEKGSYAYASVVFSIEKATVTIKPNNITAYVGDEVPSLTDIGYTVTGLVGDDELTNAPTLSYESAPDMSTTGTYTIKASGAAANDELYKLVYEDGTLTVSRRSSGGGSGSSSHSVSVDSDKNGTVSVNKNNASKGSTVTITVKPDSGYELGDLIVTDKDGNEIKLTDKGNGKYTFQMPNSKVEIEASFVPQADPDIGLPFVDVPFGSWYEDAVWYVYENGLMAGTSDTTFAPDITTSRGMIVTILYRLEGTPAVSGISGFTDVADGQYYTDAVAWAAANNIVGGYGNGLFGPNDTITREQMAAILYRYAQYKGYDVTASADLSGYSDAAQVSSYALAALQWANAEGLVNGTSDTTLTPGGSATRAQVAVILMRFCENIAG